MKTKEKVMAMRQARQPMSASKMTKLSTKIWIL